MVGFLAQVENNSMEIEMNNNCVNNNNNNNIENEGASNSMDTELNNNSSNNSDSSRIETNGSPNNNSSINVDLKRYFLKRYIITLYCRAGNSILSSVL